MKFSVLATPFLEGRSRIDIYGVGMRGNRRAKCNVASRLRIAQHNLGLCRDNCRCMVCVCLADAARVGSGMVRSRLGIIRDSGVDPTRPDAGHIEGRDHAFGFAEVVPAHAGDFQYGQPLRFKRQHLVGKVYFGQATVE